MGTDRLQWMAVDATFKAALSEASHGRHVNALDLLETARRDLESITRDTVVAARADGATWMAIGDAMGVNKSSVWTRYNLLCLPPAA